MYQCSIIINYACFCSIFRVKMVIRVKKTGELQEFYINREAADMLHNDECGMIFQVLLFIINM